MNSIIAVLCLLYIKTGECGDESGDETDDDGKLKDSAPQGTPFLV